MHPLKKTYGDFLEGRSAIGLLTVRAVAGMAFIHHGWQKMQDPSGWMGPEASMPGVFQALAAISEFFGGLAWIVGLFTPLACFGILCTMTVALWMHVIIRGDPFVGRNGSYELALLFFSVALLLFLTGPGKYSLDALLFGGWGRRRSGIEGE